MADLDLSILKSLITNKTNALNFAEEFDAKLFSPETWNFANAIISYLKVYKEIPTLRVIIERNISNTKLTENITKIWSQLDSISYDDKEYKHDLSNLKKRFAEKQINSLKESLNKQEFSSIDINKTLIEFQKTIQSISSLEKSKNSLNIDVKDYLSTFVDNFNAKRNNPDFNRGIMTGYSAFDYATNGIKPSDMIIIAGETGFGKSLFLNNIAVQIWMQKNNLISFEKEGKNIIYFSLEMPYEECFDRLIAKLARVPVRSIENASISKEEFQRVKHVLDFIKIYPYKFRIVDITEASANDIENIIINSGEKFDAICLDYLGIMNPNEDNNEQDWLKQGIIAYQVRSIARKYKTPILSAVQLNRKNPNKESSESIGLSRLARSGTIATHVTHVIQIENREKEEDRQDFIYHFIKNRKGPKVKGSLLKDLKCASLIEENYDNLDLDYFKNQDDISDKMDKLEL